MPYDFTFDETPPGTIALPLFQMTSVAPGAVALSAAEMTNDPPTTKNLAGATFSEIPPDKSPQLVDAIRVEDAATVEANGDYIRGADVNDLPSWVKGIYSIEWDGLEWMISNGTTSLYTLDNSIPVGTWIVDLGEFPAPTSIRTSFSKLPPDPAIIAGTTFDKTPPSSA